jgi:hypothetical protein
MKGEDHAREADKPGADLEAAALEQCSGQKKPNDS